MDPGNTHRNPRVDMSDEAKTPAAAADGAAEAPAKGPNKLLLPLIVALMTIAGGAVGVVVVAPRLIAAKAPVAEGLEANPEAHGEAKAGAEAGPMFKIDNLIVNPLGALGSRFLMVSVAVETPNAKLEAQLRSREAQIRDIVIALLERQTMETLALPGIRDSLKTQLSDTISVIAGMGKARLNVFLPQFVIQ